MRALTPIRMITIGTVVTVSILTGSYVVGRSTAQRSGGQPAGFTAASDPARSAPSRDRRRSTRPPGPVVPDVVPGSGADRPQLPAEQGGPFGARQSTGTTDVALTFDDGPDPTYTPQVLALLRAAKVKATFCVVGSNARKYPDLIRAIAADGHTLCNHSWSHDLQLGTRSPAMIRDDLTRTEKAIHAAVPGVRIAYFRQPGGNWTPTVVAIAQQLGMTSLHWLVDPRDWSLPGVDTVVATVLNEIEPGAIVLMHDGGGKRQDTVTALGALLPQLGQRFTLRPLPYGPAEKTMPTANPPSVTPA